jgi:hypothetical protein
MVSEIGINRYRDSNNSTSIRNIVEIYKLHETQFL